jgi:A/G-specific adenine glycosylase
MNADFKMSGPIARQRRRRLLSWFDRHKRDLPWRREPSLYGTWIAETMLQQTTVAAVAKRWAAFLQMFPDVHALAGAAESEILSAWSGLGYYRRARMLHQAARQIVSMHRGHLPRDVDQWLGLPGVGRYTADAIASIGLGQAVAVVDVNVRRVLMRWTCADERSTAALTPSSLRDLANAHLDHERPSDWNQAMMDLGAELCRAGIPDCLRCPVMRWCAAGLAGTTAQVPPAARGSQTTQVQLRVLLLRRGQDILWLPGQVAMVSGARGLGRPCRATLGGLLPGMWCLPMTHWYSADGSARDEPFLRAWRRWLHALGWARPRVVVLRTHWHAITSYRLHVRPMMADWPSDMPLPDVPSANWSTLKNAPPISSLSRHSLAQMDHE